MDNDSAKFRILVAEDSPTQALNLSYLLEKQGYQVEIANNGKQALLMIQQSPPDLFLLDVVMPELNGFELCRFLKDSEKFNLIPVILVTTLNDHESRITGLQCGADDFLSKPVDVAELQARVNSLLKIKLLTDELQNSNQKLRKMDQLKENLTHMIVHDLRNPLTVIYTSSQILENVEDVSKTDQKKFSGNIFQNAQRMLAMINALLDIAKMEANQMAINIAECDVLKIAAEVGKEMYSMLQHKDIGYSVNCEDNSLMNCDGELLRRILVNIVGNAVKFSPKDKVITVNILRKPKTMLFEISDQGQGIPLEYREIVFDKFGQVNHNNDGKVYSTGLGLTFCKMAVEAHGGTIGVKGDVGQGSIFWFELPLY